MYFLIDTNKHIIFGWSAKCGCIKNIFWYLQTDNYDNPIHTHREMGKLPDNIENYITIIFTRNPYKRIISGFLDKYRKCREYKHLWKDSFLSFSRFVDKLIIYDWKALDKHHFTQQTSESFDKKILSSKSIIFYNICKIDYGYIEKLYNKKIPEYIINKNHGHKRILYIKNMMKNMYMIQI